MPGFENSIIGLGIVAAILYIAFGVPDVIYSLWVVFRTKNRASIIREFFKDIRWLSGFLLLFLVAALALTSATSFLGVFPLIILSSIAATTSIFLRKYSTGIGEPPSSLYGILFLRLLWLYAALFALLLTILLSVFDLTKHMDFNFLIGTILFAYGVLFWPSLMTIPLGKRVARWLYQKGVRLN